ncbi:hypothetical protein HRG_005436 [Hirsutella rhossiliensis]|uniref:Protein ECM13 n=1 Tax=Hirsutella rhossiliensis TaxID=111463 RepID=A0A9P8SHK7_9HYPO|nr:uncharacterized protein HRG_05436 [Hirsutella rhossiliensis]KAH0962926.1 hypothetical protein HRG_05436 [Hirsutella rhossiliensis]
MSATTASSHHPQHRNPFIRSAPKKDMSITQTYYLAHKARAKLSREAAQPDHDLRLLVGHANLLDSLMLELADAEREQERWFNQSVRGASKAPARHVQWADRVEERSVDHSSDDDSDLDEDDEYNEDDFEMANAVPVRTPALLRDDDDLEEDYAHLELVRTPSHSSSPPDLMDPDSDTSDDESMPPSPADAALPYSEKEAKSDPSAEDALDGEEYYISRRNSTGLVSAISVY